MDTDGSFQDEIGKELLQSFSHLDAALNAIDKELTSVESNSNNNSNSNGDISRNNSDGNESESQSESPSHHTSTVIEQVHDQEQLSKEDFSYQAHHSPSQPLKPDDIESPYSVYHGDDGSGAEGDEAGDDDNYSTKDALGGTTTSASSSSDSPANNNPGDGKQQSRSLRISSDASEVVRVGSTLDFDSGSPVPVSPESSIISPGPPSDQYMFPASVSPEDNQDADHDAELGHQDPDAEAKAEVNEDTDSDGDADGDADADGFFPATVDPSLGVQSRQAGVAGDTGAFNDSEEEDEEEDGDSNEDSGDSNASTVPSSSNRDDDESDEDDNDEDVEDVDDVSGDGDDSYSGEDEEEEEEEGNNNYGDEWIDDDDTGYVYVPVSADEFECIEEEASQQLLALQEMRERLIEEGIDPDADVGVGLGMYEHGLRPPRGLYDQTEDRVDEEEEEEEEDDDEEEEEEDDEEAYHDAYEGYEDDLQAAEQYLQSQEQTSHIQLDQPSSTSPAPDQHEHEHEHEDEDEDIQQKEEEGEQQQEQEQGEGEVEAEEEEEESASEFDLSGGAASPVKKAVQEDLEAAANRSFSTPMGPGGGVAAAGGLGSMNTTPSTTGFGTPVAVGGAPGVAGATVTAAGDPASPFDTSEIKALIDQGTFGGSLAAAGTGTRGDGNYSAPGNKARDDGRLTLNERRRNEIIGQQHFEGVDGKRSSHFNLKVIFEPFRTGFEENKEFQPDKGVIIAGRYEVQDVLGEAAFSTALRCLDCCAEEDEDEWVCLKVIKNNKDFFDQSLDEIKLLQYINSNGDPDSNHVLRLIDFFYCQEHLFIVSELLRENLYEFGKAMRDAGQPSYFTLPRLKKIMKECLSALAFIHSLKLIHCDVKPENIVVKSYSRCEVKLIDFGSSCYTTDHLTTYIQSRSYRAPEVVLGCKYDQRIDIWSIGGVLAELYTGYVLFQNDSLASMLARITGILGPFPESVLQSGAETNKYFTLSNIVYEPISSPNAHNSDPNSSGYNLIYPKKTTLAQRLHLPSGGSGGGGSRPASEYDSLSTDDLLFLDFNNKLLNLDHTKRLTAVEALRHPWLADAGLNPADYAYIHPDL